MRKHTMKWRCRGPARAAAMAGQWVESLELRTLLSGWDQPILPTEPVHNALAIEAKPRTVKLKLAPAQIENEQPFLSASGSTLTVRHRERFTAVIATFQDSAEHSRAKFYRASIDWGGGRHTRGMIVPKGQGQYEVIGRGRYFWGWHNVKVTIRDIRPKWAGKPGRSGQVQSSVYAAPPAIAGIGVDVHAVEGQTFLGTVARFVGLDRLLLDRYEATVGWAWEQEVPATLVDRGHGVVDVVAERVFPWTGEFPVRVQVREKSYDDPMPDEEPIRFILDGRTPLQVAGQPMAAAARPRATAATVIEPAGPTVFYGTVYAKAVVTPGGIHGNRVDADVLSGSKWNGTIATFTMDDPSADISHLRAIVKWADGLVTAGTAEPEGEGGFAVKTERWFADDVSLGGWVQAEVLVYDDRLGERAGTVAAARSGITVKSHLRLRIDPLTVTAGEQLSMKVGELEILGSPELWESRFIIDIYWGDSRSLGKLEPNDHGSFDIIGEHMYPVRDEDREYLAHISVFEYRTPLHEGMPTPEDRFWTNADIRWNVKQGEDRGFRLESQDRAPNVDPNQLVKFRVATIRPLDSNAKPEDFSGKAVWDDGVESELLITRSPYGWLDVDTQRIFEVNGTMHYGVVTVSGAGVTRTTDIFLWSLKTFDSSPHRPNVESSLRQTSAAPKAALAGSLIADDVLPLPRHVMNITPVRPVAHGLSVDGVLARFEYQPTTQADPSDWVEHLGLVDWGDGKFSAARIREDGSGRFEVSGRRTYEQEGSYTIRIRLWRQARYKPLHLPPGVGRIEPAIWPRPRTRGAVTNVVEAYSADLATIDVSVAQ